MCRESFGYSWHIFYGISPVYYAKTRKSIDKKYKLFDNTTVCKKEKEEIEMISTEIFAILAAFAAYLIFMIIIGGLYMKKTKLYFYCRLFDYLWEKYTINY